MMKRKMFSIVLVLSVIVSLFTGCTGSGSNGNTAGGGDTIKIGVNYELTGDLAQYGIACVEGIEMARDEINAAGGVLGKQIELVKIDNKSDNNEAMNVATRLATSDNVLAMMGPATSGAFKATSSVSETYGVPIISCSSTANDVIVKDGQMNDWAFRTCYSDNFQGSIMGNFAYGELKATRALVLSDKANDYSQGLAEAFKKSFTELGGEIVGEEYFAATDSDFSPVLTKIKSMDFDVIYLPAYYEAVGPIIKQARAIGIDSPILGADGYDSKKMLELSGSAKALNNVFFTNHYSSGDPSEEVVNFVAAFKEKNNKEPGGFNALGYDMMKFVADAIERAGSEDKTVIKDALASTKDFKSVTGSFSIDENHDPVKATVIIEFVDGVQEFKTRISA